MVNNIIDTKIDEIHSFDAYYRNVIYRNSNLIIPYINLGLSNHPLNQSSELKFLDFSYMIFEKISYLDVFLDGKRLIVTDGQLNSDLYHFGGNYLDYGKAVFNEMEISAKKTWLQLPVDYSLSKNMWIPVNTPKFEINMLKAQVENFFKIDFFPENILNLIRLSY